MEADRQKDAVLKKKNITNVSCCSCPFYMKYVEVAELDYIH